VDEDRFAQPEQRPQQREPMRRDFENQAMNAVTKIIGVCQTGRKVGDAQGPAFESSGRKRFGEPPIQDKSDVSVLMRMPRDENTRRMLDLSQREPGNFATLQGGAVKGEMTGHKRKRIAASRYRRRSVSANAIAFTALS